MSNIKITNFHPSENKGQGGLGFAKLVHSAGWVPECFWLQIPCRGKAWPWPPSPKERDLAIFSRIMKRIKLIQSPLWLDSCSEPPASKPLPNSEIEEGPALFIRRASINYHDGLLHSPTGHRWQAGKVRKLRRPWPTLQCPSKRPAAQTLLLPVIGSCH